MRAGPAPAVAAKFDGVRRAFEHWRRTHRPRAPLPARLWARAVEVAREHGVHATARRLPLEYYALKQRLDAAGAGRGPAPAFVELPAVRPSGLGPCVIDLEAPGGGRMRIEVTGVTVTDLVTLTQGAWGRAR